MSTAMARHGSNQMLHFVPMKSVTKTETLHFSNCLGTKIVDITRNVLYLNRLDFRRTKVPSGTLYRLSGVSGCIVLTAPYIPG